MLVSGIVPVRFVMCIYRGGSVHFRKSYWLISKRTSDLQSLKFVSCYRKELGGLVNALCEISMCKRSRHNVPLFTSTWIAFMRPSRCATDLRCAANQWAWVAHAIGVAC